MIHKRTTLTCKFAVSAVMALSAACVFAERSTVIPAPLSDERIAPQAASETIVLAGGCFWGVQGVFQHVKGVSNAVSGYAGGSAPNAQYERVSTGSTGHAESVRVTFDPRIVSLGKILQVYFSVAHDPTQLNRQGPDSGTQYRSEIFALSDAQLSVARSYIAQLDAAHLFGAPIVTRLELGKQFYPAEDYHQNYLQRHPNEPYIMFNDQPKITSLKQMYPQMYREQAIQVAKAD